MASRGIAFAYWTDHYPVLLASLADQTPGMTPHEVAEMLDDLEWEISTEATDAGEYLDVDDMTLVNMYLALL